jgi:parallel beta-helix repeat protein
VAVSSSRIDLTWNASSDNVGVVGYRVYRGGVLVGSTDNTGYADTALLASTTYNYTVTAYDAAGNESAQSAAVSATTLPEADTQAPTVPTGLSAVAVSSSRIDLTWNASSDNVAVTGYRVYRGGVLLASAAGTSYSDTGLSGATTYTYAVSAYDAAGNESAQSASVSETTQAGGGGPDCASAAVLCVDDTPGATQEYSSIQVAADAAGPGDTVLVHDGFYRGMRITTSGSSGSPLVFLAKENVEINQPAPTGDGIRLQDVDYITIEGFSIRNSQDRCIAARGATATSPMRGNVIRDNTCTDAGHEGFYLSQYSNGLVENNVITGTGAVNPDKSHGIYLANGGSDFTVIRGNVISQVSGSGGAQGIHMNGDASIGGDGIVNDVLIEGNRIFDVVTNGLNMDGVQRTTIRNNVDQDHGGPGWSHDIQQRAAWREWQHSGW